MEFNVESNREPAEAEPEPEVEWQSVRRHSDNGAKVALYKSGYEDERFQQTVSQSFHCIICTGVIKDPVMCPQNEHLFCRACITRHLMYSQSCPTCVEPLTVDTLSQAPRSVRNLLAELRIRCEFFDRGCGKFVDLGDLDSHVAGCGFAPAVCSNEGCELEVNKQDLLHHETTVCELRRVQCHSCNDIRRELDTLKVNLALMNEKFDRNEKRLSETLEKIEKNGNAVEKVFGAVELIRQQSQKQEGDIREIKSSLNGIKNLLETTTQQSSHEGQEAILKAREKMPKQASNVCAVAEKVISSSDRPQRPYSETMTSESSQPMNDYSDCKDIFSNTEADWPPWNTQEKPKPKCLKNLIAEGVEDCTSSANYYRKPIEDLSVINAKGKKSGKNNRAKKW